MSYRLSSQAEAQLDDIWLYIARESGSIDTAVRIVQKHQRPFLAISEAAPHGAAA